ncbi:hypothetical protein ACHAP9_002780, partial [Verticillium nonalfalfae]
EGKWLSGWVSGLGARGIQRSIENIASSKTEAQIGKSREDMREGWMRTESRNLNFNNVLSVVEQQNFSLPDTTDPADPTATTNVTTTVVYKSRLGERLRARRDQSASSSAAAATTATAEPKEGKWLSGWVSGLGARGIQRSIENIASSKTEAQIGKSREGMRVVLERLRHTGVGGVLEMMRRERQLA